MTSATASSISSKAPRHPAGPDEGVDHPEAAGNERSLFLVHAGVAVEEWSLPEFGDDGVDGRRQAGPAFEAGATRPAAQRRRGRRFQRKRCTPAWRPTSSGG